MMKKYRVIIPALVVLFLISLSASGQSKVNQRAKDTTRPSGVKDTTVSEKAEKLGEVIVSSMRINRKLMEVPASMSISSALDYKKNSAFTVANVLNSEPGISFGSDGVWSTNVVVRGLGEGRLVTLIDGDRVETATDLTASLSMTDVNDIERVEVIKEIGRASCRERV